MGMPKSTTPAPRRLRIVGVMKHPDSGEPVLAANLLPCTWVRYDGDRVVLGEAETGTIVFDGSVDLYRTLVERGYFRFEET
jgi:hypothetical protein